MHMVLAFFMTTRISITTPGLYADSQPLVDTSSHADYRSVRSLTAVRYFKCLTAIETRFPISNEKGNVRISFPWNDAFRSSKRTSQANIHFEKAAILFNVAAVLSQQALQVERSTAEGITQACKLFQVSWCG